VLLSHLSGKDDVVIRTPTANRICPELKDLIGVFRKQLGNALGPLVSANRREPSATGQSSDSSRATAQQFPFHQVVEILRPSRSLGYTPVFRATFAWQNTATTELKLEGLTLAPLESRRCFSKFDLTLELAEGGGRITGGLEYATALFERSTVERYAVYLHRLLQEMIADETGSVAHLPMLGDTERRRLIIEWNATEVEYPSEQCVHELFEAQAAATPKAIALEYEQSRLTYPELNMRANQLAHHLRKVGVKPDALVGICVERSIDMIVGFWPF
jgi:non-ribosomal peptide synthetase component F